MVTKTIDDVIDKTIQELKEFMDMYQCPYDRWFVGISDDPRKRLSEKHLVNKTYSACIIRQTPDPDVAWIVGIYLTQVLGAEGSLSNGRENATFIYTYLKTKGTRP